MSQKLAALSLLAPLLLATACGDTDADAGETGVPATSDAGDGGDTSDDSDPDDSDDGADSDDTDDATDAPSDSADGSGEPPDGPLNGIAYEPPECATFAFHGPWEVGVTTLQLTEGERTVGVEVFYPTAAASVAGRERFAYDMRQWLPEAEQGAIPDDAAPFFVLDAYREVAAGDDGPWPLVIFSHGLAGYRLQSGTLLAHLASWGYVVASADHPERGLAKIVGELIPGQDQSPGTVRAMIELLRGENDGDGLLAGTMNFELVAMTGHSAGGGTTFAVANDEIFDAFISYAAGARSGLSENPPSAAGLLVAGETDGIVQITAVAPTYDAMAAPKGFVSLANAGHLPFSDLCAIGRDRGGILQIAAEYGIEVNPLLIDLGSDGCRDEDMSVEVAWPIIHHVSVAWLRRHLSGETDGAGLGEELDACFGEHFARQQFQD